MKYGLLSLPTLALLTCVCAFAPLPAHADDSEIKTQISTDVKNLPSPMQEVHAKAMQADAAAQYTLGHAYFYGKDVPKNEDFAVFWLKESAKQGHADALALLGTIEITHAKYKNTERGLQLLEEAMEKDAKHSATLIQYLFLGEIYGIKRDKKAAQRVVIHGAKNNDIQSLAWAAYFFFLSAYDHNNTENYAKASQLAELLADKDIPLANTVIAWLFSIGEGGAEQDHKTAFEYAQKAAQAGEPEGMALLAAYYMRGVTADKDIAQAVQWAQRSAALGSDLGRVVLGSSYIEGQGLTQDLAKGYAYITLAADNGHAEARSLYAHWGEKLTPEQLKQAQDYVTSWRKQWGF